MLKVAGLFLITLLGLVAGAPIQIFNSVNETSRFQAVGYGINGSEHALSTDNVPTLFFNYSLPVGAPVRIESIVVVGDTWSNDTVDDGFFYYEYLAQAVYNGSSLKTNTTLVSIAQPNATSINITSQVSNVSSLFSSWNETGSPLYADSLVVLFTGKDSYGNNESLSTVVSNVNSSLYSLYKSGARTFSVLGLPKDQIGNETLADAHNVAVKKVVAQFDAAYPLAHAMFVNISALTNNSNVANQSIVNGSLLTPIAHQAIAVEIIDAFVAAYGNCTVCNSL